MSEFELTMLLAEHLGCILYMELFFLECENMILPKPASSFTLLCVTDRFSTLFNDNLCFVKKIKILSLCF